MSYRYEVLAQRGKGNYFHCCDAETVADIAARADAEIAELRRELAARNSEFAINSARWEYAKCNLFQAHSVNNDGTAHWHGNGKSLPRAKTIDAAIDAARSEGGWGGE